MLQKLIDNPRLVFFCDAIGACLSALFIGLLLIPFQSLIGLPYHQLQLLTAIAVLLAIGSFTGYFFVTTKWRVYLRLVLFANMVYAIFTVYSIIHYRHLITQPGLAYFSGELLILTGLMRIEWLVIQKGHITT